jgi:hypothetical protein
MMAEQDEVSIQVAFNLSQLQIQEVFRLLQLADDYHLKHKYPEMIHTLIATKLSVVQSLTDVERKVLAKKEKALKIYLLKEHWAKEISWTVYNDPKYNQIFQKVKGDLQGLAEDYKESLMDIIEKHGYLIKHMEDFKRMF